MSGPATWMPFYIGDYLRDTQHLNAEKHGAYVLLIFSYWASGRPLVDDDDHLATICRMPVKRWRSIRPVIERFFHIEAGEWRHKRIDAELAKAEHNISKRRAAGLASAQQRANKRSTHVEQVYQQTGRPSPSPSPSTSEERKIPPIAPRKRGVADTPEFLAFYDGYPNKVGKGAARKAFAAAILKANLAAILEGVERYKRSKPPDREWCHPATFLNQERWLDEPAKIEVINGRHGLSAVGSAKKDWWDVSKPAPPSGPPPSVVRS